MHRCAFLAAFLATASRVAAHPLCYVDERPTDVDQVLSFCPAAQAGACCTDVEEAAVEARVAAAEPLTDDCRELYLQVQCGQCHSYSGHLFEVLGAELGVEDGMTMKSAFCEELVDTCEGQIVFPTYDDGTDYCEKHTGGGDDLFWSYPYEEPEIFEAGLTESFPGVDFPSQTITVHQSPDGSMFWFGGQAGEITSVDSSDSSSTSTVVDISGGDFNLDYEEGLIDFAFGPMFSVSGSPSYFYLSYQVQLDDGLLSRNRLSKFEYFPDDPAATLGSEEILITTAAKASSIHSAGWCGFKPSDYGSSAASHDLYWSIGDGGPQEDPLNTGQDTAGNLLASIVRISVPSDGTGYTIPSGNLASPALPEICANGFRNPWRCGFDRDTDDLWCGDVGHTNVEEIDIIECGNNYGWSRFEGSRCQEAQEDRDGPCAGADRSGFTFPVFEYCHPDYYDDVDEEQDFTAGVDICGGRMLTGNVVIGGYVYRGTYFADLIGGAYVFGDQQNNNVYYIKEEEGTWTAGTIISDGSVSIIGFAEDNNGELMMISEDYNIYNLPCGDFCGSTCLDQADDVPTFESLGCFADEIGDRALEIQPEACDIGDRQMSAQTCAAYCATVDGATYAGVQFSFQCFCGTASSDYDKHGSLPSTSCNMACAGAVDGELCGGNLAMEIFELGEVVTTTTPPETTPPVTTPPVTSPPGTTPPVTTTTSTGSGPPSVITYLGCYADSPERVFTGGTYTQADMTSELCAELCADSAYFGTQYSVECWCSGPDSNSAFNTDYAALGAGECDYVCGADTENTLVSEICGGFWANSVYANFENVVA